MALSVFWDIEAGLLQEAQRLPGEAGTGAGRPEPSKTPPGADDRPGGPQASRGAAKAVRRARDQDGA